MTIAQLSRQTARLLIHVPSIGIASLVFSIATHLASLRADLLDIANPWWILTVGLVLLASPLYHALVISRVAAHVEKRDFSVLDVPLEAFGGLVLGEILVNAGVILGGALLVLPGMYIGLRAAFYKQAIVLHKTSASDGIRASFRLTAEPRILARLLMLMAAAYCLPIAIDFLLTPASQGPWIHPVAVLVSTVFLAWINVAVTMQFLELASHEH